MINSTNDQITIEILESKLRKYKLLIKQLRTTLLVMVALIGILVIALLSVIGKNNMLNQELRDLKVIELKNVAVYQEQLTAIEAKYVAILHSTSDWKELVYTMQGEAGGEGLLGIKHVTSTVINRLETKHWGTTIHAVLSAPRQYSAYGITYKTMNPEVIKAVDEVLLYGSINEAIFYMNPVYSASASRSWMRTKPFLLKYKNHEFYGG